MLDYAKKIIIEYPFVSASVSFVSGAAVTCFVEILKSHLKVREARKILNANELNTSINICHGMLSDLQVKINSLSFDIFSCGIEHIQEKSIELMHAIERNKGEFGDALYRDFIATMTAQTLLLTKSTLYSYYDKKIQNDILGENGYLAENKKNAHADILEHHKIFWDRWDILVKHIEKVKKR